MSFRRTSNTRTSALETLLAFDVKDLYPTESDILYALERQKTRIITRTTRGVDAENVPFAPYNNTRPYYYYPNGPVGAKHTEQSLKRAQGKVKRTATRLGRTKRAITRSGLGLRFPSYAAFKLTYLGRSNVDLTGPRAPHMLQSIVTQADGSSGTIGIYGQPGIRAAAHNDGLGHQPRRRFFESTDKDNLAFADDIKTRVTRRISDKYGIPSLFERTAA